MPERSPSAVLPEGLDYDEIRQKVEAEVEKRKRGTRGSILLINSICYVLSMLIMWYTALTVSGLHSLFFESEHSPAILLLMMPTIFWGMALFLQFLGLTIDRPGTEKSLRDEIAMKEVSRAILQQSLPAFSAERLLAEKPKRQLAVAPEMAPLSPLVRLSDDGELVPLDPGAVPAVGTSGADLSATELKSVRMGTNR